GWNARCTGTTGGPRRAPGPASRVAAPLGWRPSPAPRERRKGEHAAPVRLGLADLTHQRAAERFRVFDGQDALESGGPDVHPVLLLPSEPQPGSIVDDHVQIPVAFLGDGEALPGGSVEQPLELLSGSDVGQ